MKTTQHNGLSWNLGGLLGISMGCSAWMASTPFWPGWHIMGVSVALLCVGVILIMVPLLWRMRSEIGALAGINILLAVTFVSNSIFLVGAHFMGLAVLSSWPPPRFASALESSWGLLLFPALGLLFWFLDHHTKNKSEQAAPCNTH